MTIATSTYDSLVLVRYRNDLTDWFINFMVFGLVVHKDIW